MALKLLLPVKFMNSDYLPQVCLFSGRTDQVHEKSFTLDYCHIAVRIITGILLVLLYTWLIAAIVYMIARKSISLTIPQADWERTKWSFKRGCWAIVIVVLPLIGCIAGGVLSSGGGDATWAIFTGVSCGLALLIAIGLGLWGHFTTVSVRMVEADTVQLKFPDNMESVYAAYRDAYEEYRNSRSKNRRRRSDEDDGDWADDAEGTWDQSKDPGSNDR